MARRLPSLNGLRAFEAAARHASFAGAARELNVTPTAISRSVRLLEARLGFALFLRHASALALTAQGRTLAAGLTDALDSIADLTESVAAMEADPVLTVGVAPALAVNWLIPRLAGFRQSHPTVAVRIAGAGASRPVCEAWNCTIRRAAEPLPGHVGEPLFASAVVPVCTPRLARALRTPADLATATLIRASNMRDEWPGWFALAGLSPSLRSATEVTFESNAMAMQGALDGVGVAMAQITYARNALADGRLVAPFPPVTHPAEQWRLEYRDPCTPDAPLRAFRTWLVEEAARERTLQAAFIARSLNSPPMPH